MNNLETVKNLNKTNTTYVKEKIKEDEFINEFAFTVFGSFDVLDYPVCPKCEGIATYDLNNRIYCRRCGGSSVDGVLTLREYLKEELKLRDEV